MFITTSYLLNLITTTITLNTVIKPITLHHFFQKLNLFCIKIVFYKNLSLETFNYLQIITYKLKSLFTY